VTGVGWKHELPHFADEDMVLRLVELVLRQFVEVIHGAAISGGS
jgi:hypothetical protein